MCDLKLDFEHSVLVLKGLFRALATCIFLKKILKNDLLFFDVI